MSNERPAHEYVLLVGFLILAASTAFIEHAPAVVLGTFALVMVLFAVAALKRW